MELLHTFFKEYCSNATVWAYGSRVDNTAHSGSDLDLAISDLNNNEVGIADIRDMIKEINIPYLIDIFELSRLPKSFQSEIIKNRVEIYPNLNAVCEVEDE